jgi:hypothetical protein
MSEQAILWLAGVVIGFQVTILGLIIKHMNDCRDFRGKVSSLGTDVEHLYDEVGRDHNSGLRGRTHYLENEHAAEKLQRSIDENRA